MKNEPALKRSDRDGIATLTLNRPQQRNALSRALIAELHDALRRIADDRSVRVVVLAGAGPAFCSGHDLKEMRANTEPAFYEAVFGACSAMMLAIVKLPQPVIARVHATATAAGCQLVASCDLAIASEAASFATPGVDIGLFCSTPMVALSRNVSRKQAMEMLLTGEPIAAATARDIGLVNRVVAAGTERDAAIELAEKVALNSAYTIKLGKEAFYRQAEMSLAGAYRYAAEVMVENMMARDAAEGIGAFIEKRDPKWQDE
ncbi:MAG TPA: enoyl-CoA hydratase [Bradyrhizobium sp.]|uniref:enoyl-CoA hydratase n=1 Tax=Bradyrhizobium sp. TaxID=376 RepID=UPI002BCC887D|nr:enoyl-CoA hydratase [Bradyrhizobium sp.]HTB05075.1 enoyl-CoA hydratase [Bradyrhizobium sp.]